MKKNIPTEGNRPGIGVSKGGVESLAKPSLSLPNFDPKTHQYSIDGKTIPSVTQILSPLNDFSMVDPGVMERAKAFGNSVHDMIRMDCSGELDVGSLDPILQKILESFHSILTLNRWKILLFEQMVFHPVHHYAGTFDLLVVDRFKKIHLIELKTRDARPEYDELQTVAYQRAIEATYDPKIKIQKRFVMSLYHTGEVKITELNRKEVAWNTFLSLLNVYRWKKNYTKE